MNICFVHLDWRGDALTVYYGKMKNDQTGERLKEPRHVYANVLDVEICPVFAIAQYLLYFPLSPVSVTPLAA